MLQFRAVLFDMFQSCQRRRHCQWMQAECPAKHNAIDQRIRIVSILPCATIDRIHQFASSGNHTNWKSATDHFSVSGHVGFDVKPSLSATRMCTESGYHFIKNE